MARFTSVVVNNDFDNPYEYTSLHKIIPINYYTKYSIKYPKHTFSKHLDNNYNSESDSDFNYRIN